MCSNTCWVLELSTSRSCPAKKTQLCMAADPLTGSLPSTGRVGGFCSTTTTGAIHPHVTAIIEPKICLRTALSYRVHNPSQNLMLVVGAKRVLIPWGVWELHQPPPGTEHTALRVTHRQTSLFPKSFLGVLLGKWPWLGHPELALPLQNEDLRIAVRRVHSVSWTALEAPPAHPMSISNQLLE